MHPQLNQNMKFSKYILGKPGASLLVVPNKMPNDLKQAHANLDDAVDKSYRSQGFTNTEERLAHLLARYEKLVEAEEQTKTKKKN